jgi:hypothetical protein
MAESPARYALSRARPAASISDMRERAADDGSRASNVHDFETSSRRGPSPRMVSTRAIARGAHDDGFRPPRRTPPDAFARDHE